MLLSFSIHDPFLALLTTFLVLVTPFPRIFIIKGSANNGIIPPSCPFPALVTPFSDIAFINEETIGCNNEKALGTINEAAISAIIAPRNPPSCCFISCFTVSVTPSINRPDFHSGSAVLTISSISSFKMNS